MPGINFRQIEENHIMENVIYNELLVRGYNVDVGVVNVIIQKNRQGHSVSKQLEVDFVCNKGSKRYYIQSAYTILIRRKCSRNKILFGISKIFFKKIIITKRLSQTIIHRRRDSYDEYL